jgi:hypothetical protein
MSKPYSILAAALVASGRSLSTIAIAASIDRPRRHPTEELEEWLPDSDGTGSLKLETLFATDPSAERALENVPMLAA